MSSVSILEIMFKSLAFNYIDRSDIRIKKVEEISKGEAGVTGSTNFTRPTDSVEATAPIESAGVDGVGESNEPILEESPKEQGSAEGSSGEINGEHEPAVPPQERCAKEEKAPNEENEEVESPPKTTQDLPSEEEEQEQEELQGEEDHVPENLKLDPPIESSLDQRDGSLPVEMPLSKENIELPSKEEDEQIPLNGNLAVFSIGREDIDCSVDWQGWVLMEYTLGKIVGLDTSYGTIGGQFGGLFSSTGIYAGIESGFSIASAKEQALNINLITRGYHPEWDIYWGAIGFYDYRKNRAQFLHEVGGGGELYFPSFFLMGNFYIPIGKNKEIVSTHVYDFAGGFVAKCREIEAPFRGFNFDVGKEMSRCGCLTFTPTIGPYYFTNDQAHFWGGKASGMITWQSRIGANFTITHDSWFGTRISGGFFLTIPFGCGWGSISCPYFKPVSRFRWIPVTDTCCWDWNW